MLGLTWLYESCWKYIPCAAEPFLQTRQLHNQHWDSCSVWSPSILCLSLFQCLRQLISKIRLVHTGLHSETPKITCISYILKQHFQNWLSHPLSLAGLELMKIRSIFPKEFDYKFKQVVSERNPSKQQHQNDCQTFVRKTVEPSPVIHSHSKMIWSTRNKGRFYIDCYVDWWFFFDLVHHCYFQERRQVGHPE